MKRTIFFFIVILLCCQAASAYDSDFSAVAPSGQTLYYNIIFNDRVEVTCPYSFCSFPCGNYTKPVGDLIVPDSVTYSGITYPVTSIGAGAFYQCTGLTSVTIPLTVTDICDSAFSQCTGLTSVTIPTSVTNIHNSAFYRCTGLTSVTIPNSVISIGGYAFYQCTGLTSVTIPNSVTSISYSTFSLCTGLTSVTIPNSVTSIGNSAFFGCTGLISVTIPDSVTSIGSWAFHGCSGLTSVTIGNSVTDIMDRAFTSCTGLTSVTIPNSVTSIGSWAFSGCTGLTSVSIGNSVTNICVSAFADCTGLTSVTIPNSVTSIGSWAFSGCTGLTSVSIGNSVTYIGGYAFYECTGLTSVSFPNSVTIIGDYAFNNCTGLTSVTIPNSIIRIGVAAFAGTGLTSITILKTSPPSGFSLAFAFGSLPSNYMVYIPCGSYSWYATIISSGHLQEMYYELSAESVDESTGAVQILTEPSCTNHNAVLSAVPADGYCFDHWSTGSTDNPYTLTVTSDTTITAFFVETYTVTVLVDNPATGSITGSGVYGDGSSVSITAYPSDGYCFNHWSNGSTDNPYTMTVTSDTTITAFFEEYIPETYIVTVLVDNPATGSVSGGGVYEDGSSVSITAYPAEDYLFDHWSTGSTDNPYTLAVTTDTTIIAYFVSSGTQGIGEVEEDDIHIKVFNGRICVEGITNEEVRVYDITGRMVQNHSLPSGVYIVKVGTLPAQKVVVMR